jgi:hypothetical protein
MKVRYKIKIETRPKARELDQQHAEIIWELLRRARGYRAGQGKGQDMTAITGDIPQALATTTGPGGQVPVAFLGRTSGERLQDPVASLRRQVRNARA